MSSPRKGLYDPKTFVAHAALLHQACAQCESSLTAASRRSLGRLSVPVWLAVLSDQLPIVALVGRHPANQLIGRGPLPGRPRRGFAPCSDARAACGLSRPFGRVSPTRGQVAHAFLSRPPLGGRSHPVRLACFRHAASVYPEPGSNSPSTASESGPLSPPPFVSALDTAPDRAHVRSRAPSRCALSPPLCTCHPAPPPAPRD